MRRRCATRAAARRRITARRLPPSSKSARPCSKDARPMAYLRLRQICLVARALEPAVADLPDIFGLAVCYRAGNVGKYGLGSALFPIGPRVLDVGAPTAHGPAAG